MTVLWGNGGVVSGPVPAIRRVNTPEKPANPAKPSQGHHRRTGEPTNPHVEMLRQLAAQEAYRPLTEHERHCRKTAERALA